jgi:cytochrome c oxidase assembly protein subunit 15
MNYIKLNRRSGILTISSVFLLLIAGGVVRSSGSGMGCPDWPKCYGSWTPPGCECQLPENYREIFAAKRLEKTQRFAGLLNSLGLSSQANLLLTDPNLKKTESFNPLKAWTEYINRIIGVLSGVFSLVYLLSLFKVRKFISKTKYYAGIAGFIMMLFNGWFGSIVVATNLFPITITIHYIAAYAVLALFIFSMVNARVDSDNSALLKYKWYLVFFLLISLVQLVYGTGLREVSDRAIAEGELYIGNDVNFDYLGSVFKAHWLLAVSLIILGVIPLFLLKNKINRKWYRLMFFIPLTLLIQYFSGVLNLRYSFPMAAQVSHIFFAGIIFGITLYICIAIFRAPKNTGVN